MSDKWQRRVALAVSTEERPVADGTSGELGALGMQRGVSRLVKLQAAGR